jgi:large subunit ribosomal protein L9
VALLVTEGNKQQIERERGKFEAKEQEEKKVADAMAARLVGVEIQIARKVGETEVLFGSVTSADIAAAMAAKGFEIDRRKLNLREPIKKLGEYDVPLRLHLDVTVPVKVKVVAEGSDKGKTQS